jgi:hypothetical protein
MSESVTPDLRNADLRKALQADVAGQIAMLLATVTNLNAITALTNAEINQNPAPVIKDVAREVKTCARQTVRLARLVAGVFDSAETGGDPSPPSPHPEE